MQKTAHKNWPLTAMLDSAYPTFILCSSFPHKTYTQKMNLSMFAESRANTNVHHFHVQTAHWWPFWISDFSQTSSIWHVFILSIMLPQYENNRSYSVVIMIIRRQMCNFYIEKWAENNLLVAILNFRFQPKFIHMACSHTE